MAAASEFLRQSTKALVSYPQVVRLCRIQGKVIEPTLISHYRNFAKSKF